MERKSVFINPFVDRGFKIQVVQTKSVLILFWRIEIQVNR